MDNRTDISDGSNGSASNFQSITHVHELSPTEYYVGVSSNGQDPTLPIWQIRRIVKIGGVWETTLYPNGNQGFSFIWDLRLTYTYE